MLKSFLGYLRRVGASASILLNVTFLLGDYSQTFCARNFEWFLEGKWNLVEILDVLLGKDHCYNDFLTYRQIKKVIDRRKLEKME